MSAEFNKVWVVVAFLENVFQCLVSSDKLSGESQTSCVRFLNVLMVVALCEVGL